MSRVLHFLKWATGFEYQTDRCHRQICRSSADRPHPRQLGCELLEERKLLSVSLPAMHGIKPTYIVERHFLTGPNVAALPAGALTPNQVRGAYGLGAYTGGALTGGIGFNGIQGDGRGQTIAIVDAYDDPNAVSDLNAFSTATGLPTFGGIGNPTFTKLNQTGGTTFPQPAPLGSWGVEESLDIEWAHSMAPLANIILFEANDASNNLFTAVQTAAATPGVVCVSMSWGGGEQFDESIFDSTAFVTPFGHLGGSATLGGTELPGGITFLASAGDSGAFSPAFPTTVTPQYPASSPNVIAVGGTSLTVNGTGPNYTYGGETTWGNGAESAFFGGGGGGVSAYESQPSYQQGIFSGYTNFAIGAVSANQQPAYQQGVISGYSTDSGLYFSPERTYPDVSAVADPNTGVAVYDTYDFGAMNPWEQIGGTSLACPLWAGMIAVADEGRALEGLGSLDGPSQTLPDLYSLPAADFHDITTGMSIGPNSFYNPYQGYDLATGLGSPVANLLIPALTQTEVTGIGPTWGSVAGGTTVTITGTNLANATAVDFGNTPGTIISDTGGQIVATSPPGAGTVDVTVVAPTGTSPIAPADTFNYVVTASDVAELTASNGAAQNEFGRSVSVSGNTMVVGAPFTTVPKSETASISFNVDSTSAATLATTMASTATNIQNALLAAGFKGVKVQAVATTSLAGPFTFNVTFPTSEPVMQYVAVGAPLPITVAPVGAATAASQQLICGATGSTPVSGTFQLIVGTNLYQGAVYVYTGSGSSWTQTAELTASDGRPDTYFGQSVSISGNTIVVGAIGDNTYHGAAYVFTGSGSSWTQAAKLVASDGAQKDFFGSSVATSGTTIVVGADGATIGLASGQGAAYVFTQSGAAWTQAAKLTASDGAAGDSFGSTVSISGNTVAVGAYFAAVNFNTGQGAAYVFTEPSSGWTSMTQTAKLTASDGGMNDFLGVSIAISGNMVVLGAYGGTVFGGNSDQGAAYVFTQPASGWTDMSQSATLTASDGQAGDYFGGSVAISGNTVVVGAWGVTLGEGSAYVFTQSGSTWTQTDQLTSPDDASGDSLGDAVSISGNTVVLGAPLATVGQNSSQGVAYVYSLVPVAPAPAPSFAITGAASGSYAVGQTIPVKWNATNVPKGSTISLAYDTTSNWSNPKWIELNTVAAANGGSSYSWNTAGLAPGTYYLAGYLSTSSGKMVLSHLTTSFTVNAPPPPPPTFALTGPASGAYVSGQSISIKWNAANVPSGSKITLDYDTTKTWGNAKTIELNAVAAANGSGAYAWNTKGLAPGTYYVAGYLYTSSGAKVLSHLTTSFTVTASSSHAASPATSINAAAAGYISSQTTSNATKNNSSASSLTDLALLAYLK